VTNVIKVRVTPKNGDFFDQPIKCQSPTYDTL